MLLSVITPPADVPVSISDGKAHLRIDPSNTDDDDYVGLLIATATAVVDGPDGWLGRAIMPQTLELSLPAFLRDWRRWDYERAEMWRVGHGDLPCRPIQSITSVKYTDGSGVEQTLDPGLYTLVGSSLYIVPGAVLPTIQIGPAGVRIRYLAGYDDAASVPAPIRHAILLMVGHLYQNREAVTDGRINQPFEMPFGLEALLAPYRVY